LELNVDCEEFYVYVEQDYNMTDDINLTITGYSSKPVSIQYMTEATEMIRADSKKTF